MFEKIKRAYSYLSVPHKNPFITYGFAIISAFIVIFLRTQLTHVLFNASPFLIFIPGVIITSWYGGFLPGLVATIVATFVGDFFFLNPLYTFTVSDTTDFVRLLLFSTVCILISIINQSFYNQKAEKEKILKELELSEERFKRIANSAPVMLWIFNKHMEVSFMNDAFQAYLGGNASQKNFLDAVHPEQKKEIKHVFSQALHTKHRFSFECRLKKQNNIYHWVSVSAVPNISPLGDFFGYLGTCIDIHEQKQIDEQKTTFLSVIAHELRTPLATVQLINELLINKYKIHGAKKDLNDLESMLSEVESLTLLVQELLDFIRGEQGLLPLKTAQVNVSMLLGNMITAYKESFPTMLFQYSFDKEYILHVDGKRIKQVFYNLLDNAVKACDKKGTISISMHPQNANLIIMVKDTGKGIATNQQKSIFNRYYQIAEYKKGGFGLGLYIAKQIVQKHHGKIWVESKLGEGSSFFVQLPYSKN